MNETTPTPDRAPLERPPPPAAVPGRGVPTADFGLRRLRANPFLQGCLVVSFLCYGGMIALLLTKKLDERPTRYGSAFVLASVVSILSLASWFFLWLWYPALEQTRKATGRRPWIGIALEGFAIGCVAVVTLMMAVIVVYLARV